MEYLVELLVQLKNLSPSQFDAAQRIQHKAAESIGHLFPNDLVLKNTILGLEFKSVFSDVTIQQVAFARAKNKLISILEAKIDFLEHDEGQVRKRRTALADTFDKTVRESQASLIAKKSLERDQAVAKVNDLIKQLAKSNELISARNERIAVLETSIIKINKEVKKKRMIWMIGNFGFWSLIITIFIGAIVFYYDRGKDLGIVLHDKELADLRDSLNSKNAKLAILETQIKSLSTSTKTTVLKSAPK